MVAVPTTADKDSRIDVQLTSVSKYFGDFAAVDDVSFSIQQGEFFSMLGPSGCGKTTTLRMIAGFETPDQGDILIAGESVLRQTAYQRKTNMVFQSLALFPHMDVFGNIAYGLQMKKLSKKEITPKVLEILELVRLEGYEKRRISQLSGGQKQRVAIARALVNEPKVLLLDEPLGALDLKLRLQMQVELKRIQHELGSTFIYVTHDQSEALTMSDKIAVMNEGKVVQFGPPRDIYERPASRFVANFIGDTNLFSGPVRRMDGDGGAVEIGGHAIQIAPADAAAGQEVALSLRHEKVKLAPALQNLDNIVPAVVREVVFIGSLIKYYLEFADGQQVVAQMVNESAQDLYQRGEELHIGWNRRDATVLRD